MSYSYAHVFDRHSFSGDRDEPMNVEGTNVYFRGARIFRAVVQSLIEDKHIDLADHVLFTGCSAGGLSTFLHADYFRSRLPSSVSFKAAPMRFAGECMLSIAHSLFSQLVVVFFLFFCFSGIFMLMDNVDGVNVFPNRMRNVFQMQNCTGAVHQGCIVSKPLDERWRCMFAEEVYPHITTPIMPINSLEDSWSVENIFAAGVASWSRCAAEGIVGVLS